MFVIVNTQTGKEYKKEYWHSWPAIYETERGAKAALTRLKKNGWAGEEGWEVIDASAWRVLKGLKFPVKMVKKINLMSGQEFWESEDTPAYMSPACESYWSA